MCWECVGSVLQPLHLSSVLQCVAVRCRAKKCVAVCGRLLQYVKSVLQVEAAPASQRCVAVCCSMLQCVAEYWSVLKDVAVC